MSELTIAEDTLLTSVVQLARMLGWSAVHFRPALTARGWRTPVQGDGKGFPDLELWRERVVYAELKVSGRHLSTEQIAWGERIRKAGQEFHVWTEDEWRNGTIERTLAMRTPRKPRAADATFCVRCERELFVVNGHAEACPFCGPV